MSKLSSRLIINAISNVASWLVLALTSLITAPLIINQFGLKLYGVWAIFFTLVGYLNLADLGFGISLTRNLAYLKPKNKQLELRSFLTFSWLYYLLTSIASGLVLYFLGGFIGKSFNVGSELLPVLKQLYLLVPAYFFLERTHLTFKAMFEGLQKMNRVTLVTLVRNLSFIVGVVLVSFLKLSLFYLALSLVLSFVLAILIDLALFWRLEPEMLKPSWPKLDKVKKYLGYGFKIQITIGLDQFGSNTLKVMVSNLFGLQVLAIYELAFRLLNFVRSLNKMALPAVFPAVAQLASQKDQLRLKVLVKESTRYLLLFTVWVYGGTTVLGGDFFRFWLGQRMPLVVFSASALVWGYFLDTVFGPGAMALLAIEKIKTQIVYTSAFNLGFLLIGLVLGKSLGYSGLVFSVFTSSLIAFPILWQGINKHIVKLDHKYWLEQLSKTFLALVFSSVVVYLVSLFNLSVNLFTFILKGLVFSINYLLTLYFLNFFKKEDKKRMLNLVKPVLKATK